MYRIFNFFLFIFFINGNINSQVVDSTGFSSPFDCVYNHLFYLQSEQLEPTRSAQSFLLAKDQKQAISNAKKLKNILDSKGLYVYMSTIPNTNNYIDSLTGQSIFKLFPKRLPEVYLQKTNNQWQYSEETNHKIDQLFKETYPFGTYKIVDQLDHSSSSSFLGISLWKYLLIFLFIISFFLIYKLIAWFLHRSYKKIISSRFSSYSEIEQKDRISHPLSWIITFYIAKLFLPVLLLEVRWTEYILIGIKVLIGFLIAIVLLRIVDVLVHFFNIIAKKTESKLDEQLIPIVNKLTKILIIVFAGLYILSLLNVNITALIAGVSIGGLALALAAQDTVKNLIGSMMIFLDAPFQIGDYIIVNGLEGTVVEVGMRSTKIQTIDSSIITIPNGNLSSTAMTNKGIRQYRLFNTTLTLAYHTSTDQIKAYLQGLKDIILSHQKTDKEAYYVYLKSLNSSSIDILFRTKILTDSYDDELKITEELLFEIMELANSLNIDFAFPSQSIYIETKD